MTSFMTHFSITVLLMKKKEPLDYVLLENSTNEPEECKIVCNYNIPTHY